jgi:hypothetical protein
MPDDTQEKLMLLTAALFAVRLFRRKDDDVALQSNVGWPAEMVPNFLEIEAAQRTEAAERSALDAAAILAAVAKIPG